MLWRALREVPPQQISLQNTKIPWKRDVAGLMNIPVSLEGQQDDFVFDTGANLSTIAESYAKQLHLKFIPTKVDLGSSTSITSKASLAVASHLQIGNTELQNVVFLVLPDEQLSFPQIHYAIHGIIGFPVISHLGEVHILQNGEIHFSKGTGISHKHNLAMDELLPIIALCKGKDLLL